MSTVEEPTPNRLRVRERSEPADLAAFLPSIAIGRVFTVGAEVSDSVERYRQRWPTADVWAFERDPAQYDALVDAVGEAAEVRCIDLRLDSRTDTGDTFCAANGIEHVDYLCVDAREDDLDVLRGFHRMLGSFAIDLIRVDAAMNPTNKRNVPFETLRGYLEPIGYLVFRLYQQVPEKRRGPHLRRASVLFVSEAVAARHTGDTPADTEER